MEEGKKRIVKLIIRIMNPDSLQASNNLIEVIDSEF